MNLPPERAEGRAHMEEKLVLSASPHFRLRLLGPGSPGHFFPNRGPFQLCPHEVAHLPPSLSPRCAPARPPGPSGRRCPRCQKAGGCHDTRRTALAGSKVKGTCDAPTHSPDLPSTPSRLGDEAERALSQELEPGSASRLRHPGQAI